MEIMINISKRPDVMHNFPNASITKLFMLAGKVFAGKFASFSGVFACVSSIRQAEPNPLAWKLALLRKTTHKLPVAITTHSMSLEEGIERGKGSVMNEWKANCLLIQHLLLPFLAEWIIWKSHHKSFFLLPARVFT